jgi:YNFM family putative membrane transporter
MTQTAESPVRAVIFLAVAAFASAASLRICDALLPIIAQEFAVTTGKAAAVVTGFSLAYGLVQALFGPIGDRFGKFQIIFLATILAIATSLICGLAKTLPALTLARVFAGAASAGIIPLAMAWIADFVPYASRQPILARFLTGQILGIVFGQAIGGVIGDALGWRMAFFGLAGLFAIAALALGNELRINPTTRQRPANRPGGLAATMHQLAAILGDRWVGIVLLTVFFEGFLMFGSFAFVGTHLHNRFGLGFGAVGALLSIYGAGGLSYAFFAQRFVNRLGERGLAVGGGFLMSVALIIIALAPVPTVAAVGIFLAGLGFYMLHNTLQTNATQMAPQARGVAVTFFASCFFLGQAIGVALNGELIDRYGSQPGFLLSAAVLPVVGLFFALCLTRRRERKGREPG